MAFKRSGVQLPYPPLRSSRAISSSPHVGEPGGWTAPCGAVYVNPSFQTFPLAANQRRSPCVIANGESFRATDASGALARMPASPPKERSMNTRLVCGWLLAGLLAAGCGGRHSAVTFAPENV